MPSFAGGGAGSLDASFGESGIALLPEGPGVAGYFVAPEESGLAVQADGGILTVGREDGDAAVFRTTPDGVLDESFGTDGVATVDLGSLIDYFHSVAVQPDGKIVAAGTKRLNPLGDGDGAVLARFLPDGTLDANFGDGGLVMEPGTPESDTPDAFWHVAVRPDGRIITAGVRGAAFTLEAERYACYAAQYLADGSRDPAFGTDGLVRISPEDNLICLDGDLMDDGRYVLGIVMEGESLGPPSIWGAARVLPDGTLDNTFGDGGLALTESLFSMNQGVVTGPDGAVTLGGWIRGDTNDGTLFRFTDDGTPDASFGTDLGTDGLLSLVPQLGVSAALQLAMQADGKLIVTGIGTLDGVPGPYLMRMLPDGSPDASFGTAAIDGVSFLDLSEVSGGIGLGSDIGFDAQGRILLSGDTGFDTVPRQGYVARFENDITVANEPSVLPERLTLAALFPNPTHATATLEFVLSEATDVRLTLYDILGREVAVMAEGTRGAGTHTVTLDASRLVSGLYVVRLTAGSEAATRRLTIVR
jgi:uncharacterized delta-60 repeat protein